MLTPSVGPRSVWQLDQASGGQAAGSAHGAPVAPAGGDAPWLVKHLLEEDLRALGITDAVVPKTWPAALRERVDGANAFSFGAVVEGTVKQVTDFGVVLDVAHGFSAFAVADHVAGVATKAGQTVRAVVLDVDLGKLIVDVSLRPELVEQRQSRTATATAKALAALGDDVEATVQLVKRQYIVASLPAHGHAIVTVATGELGASDALRRLFQVDMPLHVHVHQAPTKSASYAALREGEGQRVGRGNEGEGATRGEGQRGGRGDEGGWAHARTLTSQGRVPKPDVRDDPHRLPAQKRTVMALTDAQVAALKATIASSGAPAATTASVREDVREATLEQLAIGMTTTATVRFIRGTVWRIQRRSGWAGRVRRAQRVGRVHRAHPGGRVRRAQGVGAFDGRRGGRVRRARGWAGRSRPNDRSVELATGPTAFGRVHTRWF